MNFVKSFNLFGVDATQIPCITGSGAPTTTTEGAVGCFYMDTDTGVVYKCTSAVDGAYTWEEFGTGSGSAEGAVLYTEQALTEEQKAQARANIGVADVSATEMADIRVGSYGETYPSAGDAVREQIRTKVDVGEIHNTDAVFDLTGYLQPNGKINNDTNAKRTDYLLCKGYTRVEAYAYLSSGGYVIAFFDAYKKLLPDASVLGDATPAHTYTSGIPEEAVFVMIAHYGGGTPTGKLINTENVAAKFEKTAQDIERVEEIANSKAGVSEIHNTDAVFDLTGYLQADGRFTNNTDAKRTDYIFCKGYNQVEVFAYLSAGGYVIAFFDAYKKLLPDASVLGDGKAAHTYTSGIPEEAAFVMIAHYGGGTPTGKLINTENAETQIQEFSQKMVDSISGGASFSAFAKWGLIGDSLSVGHTNDTSGTAHARNIYYSWGQVLARRIGNVCLNFGHSGVTAKSWMGRDNCYGRLIETDNMCQCYVIALGANDGENTNEKYTNGVGTISDIDFNNMGNNADSFFGWYAKVINSIYTVAPSAKIFLLTVPYPRNTATDVQAINNAIVEISQNNNFHNVALVDLSTDYDQYYRAGGIANMIVSGHYTAVGYANVSKVNELALSSVMNKDKTEYQDIPFIPFGNTTALD